MASGSECGCRVYSEIAQEVHSPTAYLSGGLPLLLQKLSGRLSGTAVFCRRRPDKVITRLDWEIIDTEGRYIQVDFPGLSVISLYVPSGSSSMLPRLAKTPLWARFMITRRAQAQTTAVHHLCRLEHLPSKHRFKNWR